VLLRRRHRKNPLILSASATGIIVGLLVSVSTGLAVAVTSTNTAQADSSSSVTLTAKDNDMNGGVGAPIPDLKVTVSQTAGLLSQAINVSWEGGVKSGLPTGATGGSDYLQIAQCWGEDPLNPGHPDRTTCQYGAFGSIPAATRDANVECPIVGNVRQKGMIDSHDYGFTTGTDASYSSACPRGDPPATSIPFRAFGNAGSVASIFPDPAISAGTVTRNSYEENTNPAGISTIQKTGVTPVANGVLTAPINASVGGVSQQVMGVNMSTTPFYTKYTTNEIPWAGSGADGKGAVKFEVQTAVQAPWLGCGTVSVDATTQVKSAPQSCWLVVIPRGTKDSGSSYVTKPGLWWDAWKHNIAFKLDFRPTAQRCSIGGAEKQLSGSSLMEGAIHSWQPNLCLGTTGSTFVMSTGNEAAALAKASGTAPSPMALTSRALQSVTKDPVQYAPIGISGVVISFAIDRFAVDGIYPGHVTPPEYKTKNTSAFMSMNLTPRLVAKLLTNSYSFSLPSMANRPQIGEVDLDHRGNNALTLVSDPDFLSKQTGDEWYYQYLTSISLGDLLTPNGQSDEAFQLWQYALSDQEGRDFLAGGDDGYGMRVNAYYSTVANSFSSAQTLPAVTFPKADPITTANSLPTDLSQGNDSINLLTYRPYTKDFASGAYNVLRGDGQELGSWNAAPNKRSYDKSVRNLVGTQKVLAVTTAEAAARYQNVTASLRNPAGNYVSPSSVTMSAAAAAMTPAGGSGTVQGFDFASSQAAAAPNAYPLTMPVYAALNPLQTDASLRASYANFIRYAAQAGQVPGVSIGQLPEGFTPIPQEWVDKAMISANAIEQGISPLSLLAGTTVINSTPNQAVAPRPAAVTSEDVQAPNPNPTATGAAAGALVGKPTPADPVLGPVAAAVPAGLLSGFAAAGAVPLYGRFRRRT
jgi:hypothetical protein